MPVLFWKQTRLDGKNIAQVDSRVTKNYKIKFHPDQKLGSSAMKSP